ncbi:MAG: tetratricopeptide repeat protein, partial [Acidobacteria bacterium]|nr:tetratricopeptide repeat protein [Acidobacteriota bacterium]
MKSFLTALVLSIVASATAVSSIATTVVPTARSRQTPAELRPTEHPPLPAGVDRYWLVPAAGWLPAKAEVAAAARDLARAATLIGGEKPAQALSLIRVSALAGTPLANYARYLTGLAQLGLERFDQARQTFASLRTERPAGFLLEAASLRQADAAEAQRDFAGAAAIYDEVLAQKPSAPDDVLLRLARAAGNAGNRTRSAAAYQTLYFEWPASEAAAAARDELNPSDVEPLGPHTARLAHELDRAERLFSARRWDMAREAFELVAPHAAGDMADLVVLRRSECDYYLRRYHRVREDLRPLVAQSSRRDESRYFALMATRALGQRDEYMRLTRALVDEFPASSWSEDALDSLASLYVVDNEDERADEVFREVMARFPTGRRAARASWRIGWWAYRHGRYAEAADVFERAAVSFPRSDYRPSYLYWAGQARDKQDERAAAIERFQLAVTDYANTYYGRLAWKQLSARGASAPTGAAAARRWAGPPPAPDEQPPTADLIRWLIAVEMYDEALDEVQYAERASTPTSQLAATRAWLLNKKGELRPAITLMRQTYPHVLAAGGETLPDAILKIIFPLDYWPLIRQHAALHNLDPYLLAALIGQESTFDKDVRSGANAIGLMQIVPTTGRRWARSLGIRGYTTNKLTVPEINVRIGTAY